MKITRHSLIQAQQAGILSGEQTDLLYNFLTDLPASQSRFNLVNLLYLLGAIIAISGASILITRAWSELGGLGILLISTFMQSGIIFIAEKWRHSGASTASGIAATIVVALTPLTLFGFLQHFGIWPENTDYSDYHHQVHQHWLLLELGTIGINLLLLIRYRFAFLLFPLATTLWYMSMDIAPAILGFIAETENAWFETKALISAAFGGLVFVVGWLTQKHNQSDQNYPLWLYLPATLSLLGGLFCWVNQQDSELLKLLLFMFESGLIFVGLRLKQPVISILATLGAWSYLAYLAYDLFESIIVYNLFLVISGLAMIWLASKIYKKRIVISSH